MTYRGGTDGYQLLQDVNAWSISEDSTLSMGGIWGMWSQRLSMLILSTC